MIVNRVPELLAERFGGKDEVNLSVVERETGLNYSTVSRWAKARLERFDAPALMVWCKYFGVAVGDLLVFVENEDPESEAAFPLASTA